MRVLAAHFLPITDAVLADAYEWSVEQASECTVQDILREDNAEALVYAVTARAAIWV